MCPASRLATYTGRAPAPDDVHGGTISTTNVSGPTAASSHHPAIHLRETWDMFDDCVMCDGIVEFAERSLRAGFDDGTVGVVARECMNGIHRRPTAQHGELDDPVLEGPLHKVGAKEAIHSLQLVRDPRPEMSWIRVRTLRVGSATPLSNDHPWTPTFRLAFTSTFEPSEAIFTEIGRRSAPSAA
jgi:hypothetical protein